MRRACSRKWDTRKEGSVSFQTLLSLTDCKSFVDYFTGLPLKWHTISDQSIVPKGIIVQESQSTIDSNDFVWTSLAMDVTTKTDECSCWDVLKNKKKASSFGFFLHYFAEHSFANKRQDSTEWQNLQSIYWIKNIRKQSALFRRQTIEMIIFSLVSKIIVSRVHSRRGIRTLWCLYHKTASNQMAKRTPKQKWKLRERNKERQTPRN